MCSSIPQVEIGHDNQIDTATLKPSCKAECWDNLTKLPDGGAKCNYCPHIFPMKHGSTSNANRHLQNKHFNEPAVINLIEKLREKQETKKKLNIMKLTNLSFESPSLEG